MKADTQWSPAHCCVARAPPLITPYCPLLCGQGPTAHRPTLPTAVWPGPHCSSPHTAHCCVARAPLLIAPSQSSCHRPHQPMHTPWTRPARRAGVLHAQRSLCLLCPSCFTPTPRIPWKPQSSSKTRFQAYLPRHPSLDRTVPTCLCHQGGPVS